MKILLIIIITQLTILIVRVPSARLGVLATTSYHMWLYCAITYHIRLSYTISDCIVYYLRYWVIGPPQRAIGATKRKSESINKVHMTFNQDKHNKVLSVGVGLTSFLSFRWGLQKSPSISTFTRFCSERHRRDWACWRPPPPSTRDRARRLPRVRQT